MKTHHSKTINSLKVQRDILLLVLSIFVICLVGSYVARRRIISPIADNPIIKVVYASEPQVIAQSPIEQQIKEVFGVHFNKAMLLLKGRQNECAENRGLKTDVINTNNDSIGSKDYGVFQINSHWQGFRHEGKAVQFLLDPSINIRVAYSIFKADGYSFKQWTCGKYYKI